MRALLVALVAMGVAAAPASAVPLVAVTPGNGLMFLDSPNPSATRSVTVTGLDPAVETLRGIDAAPGTGDLYAVTATTGAAANSPVRTHVIPHDSAYVVTVGATASGVAGWGDVPAGSDFNPVPDRLRLVNTNQENARINPFTGGLAANDTDLTPTVTTAVIGAAYDRSVDGAAATTLFAIDRIGSELARVGGVDGVPSPNGGVVTSIGPLGVTLNAASDAGFDIAADGTAYAALTSAADNLTRLYTINLATGAAMPIGLIGNGTTEVRSLAVVPPRVTGPPGATGSQGPPGSSGPSGPGTVRERLVALLANTSYRGRARRRLTVRLVTTVRALVTLELRRGSRRVARVADQVGPGRARMSFRRLPARGRYTLRLTAVAGGETVRDSARLRVTR